MEGEGGYFKNKIGGNTKYTKAVVPLISTDNMAKLFKNKSAHIRSGAHHSAQKSPSISL